MNRYTHILLDHDGVLVDTEPLYFRATQESLAELGIDLSLDEYLKNMVDGDSPWKLARSLGNSEAEIERTRDGRNLRYRELISSESIDIEGVEESLKSLRQKCRLAIVTTARTEDFELIHRNRQIVPLVDFVLTRSAYSRSKPYPDPYLLALQRFGIESNEALAVEDSERGLRSAVAAGIDCAVVKNTFTAKQDFSLAKYRIGILAEVHNIIDGTSID